jgi:hypothetical protein
VAGIKWNTIYQAVAFIALVYGLYYTYRQLRDKKPRLRVDFERVYFPKEGLISRPTPNLTIRLRNLTERAIKIQQTLFVDKNKRRFVLPNNWKTVDEIPAQDQRSFVVSVPQFEKWAKAVNISEPKKGRFVLIDGTGEEHKSWKVKDWMSMAPAKLP